VIKYYKLCNNFLISSAVLYEFKLGFISQGRNVGSGIEVAGEQDVEENIWT